MTQQYQPGQRWISDSEAELGLGTVLTADGRLVTVLYPASGETRQYSQRNAPLTRVRFAPGEVITHFKAGSSPLSKPTRKKAYYFTAATTRPVKIVSCRKPSFPTLFSFA